MFDWMKKRKESKERQLLKELEEAMQESEQKLQDSMIRLTIIGIMSKAGDVLGPEATVGEVLEFINSAVDEKVLFFSQQPEGKQTRERWVNEIKAKERN